MINNLNVDEYRIHNLIPLPGTKVFEQCLTDDLFLEKFKLEEYWKCTRTDFGEYKQFYIKPYKLSIEELNSWRNKLDKLISVKEKC